MITLATPQGQPMRGPQYQPQGAPPPPREPGIAEQFGDMAKKRAMEGALNAGETAVVDGAKAGYSKLAGMMAPAAAPTMSSVATPLMTAGVDAPLANAVAGQTIAGTGLTTGAATGGMAALGTAVPYIGAGLLAGKALGFFSNGGRVGPLYAADGKMAYPSYKSNYSDLSDAEILKLSPEEQDEYIKTIGIEEAMDAMYNYKGGRAGPLSKVEYKSAGGEVYKLSYGGPISKGA